MKRIYTVILILAYGTLMVCKVTAGEHEESLRMWKTVGGDTVNAKYIELKYGKVKLQAENGKFFMVDKRSLSNDDRVWIKKFEIEKNKPAGVKGSLSPDKLPLFDSGPDKGFFAVHNEKSYDACMDKNGYIKVFLKENGTRLERPVHLRLLNSYWNKGSSAVRKIAFFDPTLKPMKQPKVITLTGMLTNNVKFSVTYEFSNNGIKCYGYCKDPKNIASATRYYIRATVPASHKFPKDISRAELSKQMVGWEVVVKTIAGDMQRFAYNKPIKGMGKYLEKLTIDAPAYGKRKIYFKAGDLEKAPLSPSFYTGTCPWQGYRVSMRKKDGGAKSKLQYIKMVIE